MLYSICMSSRYMRPEVSANKAIPADAPVLLRLIYSSSPKKTRTGSQASPQTG